MIYSYPITVLTMPTSTDDRKTLRRKRKNRAGLDIAFPVPKSLSFSGSGLADPKAYYAAYPYAGGEESDQWIGKTAALLGTPGDAARKTIEQIEADVDRVHPLPLEPPRSL